MELSTVCNDLHHINASDSLIALLISSMCYLQVYGFTMFYQVFYAYADLCYIFKCVRLDDERINLLIICQHNLLENFDFLVVHNTSLNILYKTLWINYILLFILWYVADFAINLASVEIYSYVVGISTKTILILFASLH